MKNIYNEDIEICIENIKVGQVLMKNGVEYIVLEKRLNGSDNYYDYLILAKLDDFKFDNERDLNYMGTIYVGEDCGYKLEDFIMTDEEYVVEKIYRIY